MRDHWTDNSIQYNSIKMNVIDTNSDVNSRLLDLKRQGLTEFAVNKLGKIVEGTIDIPHVNSLEETITVLSAAGLTHVDFIAANTSVLNANLSFANNSLAIVYADPTILSNDYYYKSGDSGTGTWNLTGLIPALVEQLTPRKAVARTFYVTMSGSDDNTGQSIYKPKATIMAALEAAALTLEPCIVIVHPGEYEVSPNTEVPANCALYGYDVRVTKLTIADTRTFEEIEAGISTGNMFLLNSGTKVRGFTFTGLQHEPYTFDVNQPPEDITATPPKEGYAFAFKPGAYITRSPYISDCTQIHNLTYQQMSLPMDRTNGNPLCPIGGGNLYADGEVLDPDSPLRSVVIDSFTAVNPNGVGYAIVNAAFVQLVSVFTNWSRVGIWSHAGGQVTITNSNVTFGDYTFVASGYRTAVRVTGVSDPSSLTACVNVGNYVKTNVDDIVDYLMAVRYPSITGFNTNILSSPTLSDLTARDSKTLLLELADDLISGQDRGTIFFTQGLFKVISDGVLTATSTYVFDPLLKTYFISAWDEVKAELKSRTTIISGAEDGANNMIDSLVSLISTVITDPTPYTSTFQSKIEASSHQFSYAGSGINYNALPFGQKSSGLPLDPTSTLLKIDGGVIYATFNTERGDTYLGEDLRVDFERSTIEGQAFSRGVQNIALPLIIGIGG